MITQSLAPQGKISSAFEGRKVSVSRVSEKLHRYLRDMPYGTPILVVDIDRVRENYEALQQGCPQAQIYYAMKANPAPQILQALSEQGSFFDVASRGEVDMCLAQGIPSAHLSFGNTIKKVHDIAYAYNKGVRMFAADADEEIYKLAHAAPGSKVFIRVLVEMCEADWPLSRKFGCAPENVLRLLRLVRAHGLVPYGLSFHVGSQTRHPEMWDATLQTVAGIWQEAQAQGVDLQALNMGGGFPTNYTDATMPCAELTTYVQGVMAHLKRCLPHLPKKIILEPGRCLVGDAGVIRAEVVLVSKKRASDLARWVYLDIGKFSGLAETMDEAIRYPIETPMDHTDEHGPCILAGPSCDSVDILYEKRPLQLPMDLRAGDEVRILSAGAYTSTYASVAFNGFEPLQTVCV